MDDVDVADDEYYETCLGGKVLSNLMLKQNESACKDQGSLILLLSSLAHKEVQHKSFPVPYACN